MIEKEVKVATKRIRQFIRETPLEYSPGLSQLGNCQVYLKCENLQITGSFKLRGAANKLLSLTESVRKRGLITASSGNHGYAFAYLTRKLGCRGIVVLPENAAPAKVKALRDQGSEILFFGDDCLKSEFHAREVAKKDDLLYISPYNDLKIIAGQGTVGVEIQKQMGLQNPGNTIDAVLVPVGGGGLISGIGGYLKSDCRCVEIIGCQPIRSPVMWESIKAGKIIKMDYQKTLSDGSAGGIEKNAITFDLCKKWVDQFILVSEEEIKEAIKFIMTEHYLLVEGSAVLTVAGFIQKKEQFKNKNVVLILSGSKISLDQLREILDEAKQR